MIYINDKEVNFIYNLGQKVKEVFSYGTKIWPKEVLFDYMYFKLADGYTSGNVSYKFDEYYNLHNKYLKYSTDGNNWSDWTEQISMTPNVKYFVKGEDDYVRNSDISGGFFTSDVSTQNFNIECGGNVMSLCNNVTEITVPYCLRSLFQKITNLVTAPKLPATTLKDNCYFGMFEGCSSLISTPELPATTLTVGCYEYMFQNCSSLTEVSRLPAMELKDKCYMCMFYSCSSLTQAPALPATTLSYCCYTGMFQGCSSLTQAPALPATTLVKECYRTMFNNCTSLTQAPALPATTLADYCYSYMFQGCSSLTQAHALPATTLSYCCYTGMFQGCTSLTQAPELPATTLVKECYRTMFRDCSSLTQAPELPATTLADYCYSNMFRGCSSLTQAPALPATTLADYCYYSMFYGCTSLTQVPELPATTLANYCYYSMFSGCTLLTQAPELPATTLNSNCYYQMFLNSNKLNWIKALFTTTPSTSYTKSWVNGVSAKGVFVKNINATWTTTGVNAVPTGWTVIYYDQTENKYFTTRTKEVECDKYGNVKQEIDAMYFQLADGETSGNVSYQFAEYYNLHNKYLKISTDCRNWQDWTEQISMSPNTKYFVKGEDDYVRNSIKYDGFFTSDVSQNQFNIKCGGNVMSLCNMKENITTNNCFFNLFYNMKNLLTPPELPATTLADYCYDSMFRDCSSLTQATALPATTLANSCYNGMFMGCSSLTQAPALPATTLANSCYGFMFSNCSSLTQAPSLPATTLADSCYTYMFSGCRSLTEAPELPATTLTKDCYSYMFSIAKKLNWIKALFTTIPSTYTKNWLDGVSAKGVFVKSIDANWITTGNYAVPTGWTVIYYDKTENKYYTTKMKNEECDKYGNPLV